MAIQIGIINVGNVGYGNMQLSVEYDLIKQDVNSNISTVRLYEYLHIPTGSITWSRGSAMLHGTTFAIATTYYAGKNLLKTMDINIGHDANGNSSFHIGYSISTSYGVNGSGNTSVVNLPNIPRYSNITSITVENRTCLSVNLSSIVDRTVNKTEYQIKEQGGTYSAFTTVKTGNHTSASWTVDKLKPNTTYVVNVHVTNAQSGLRRGKEYTVKTLALSTAKSNVVNYDEDKQITITRENENMNHKVYIKLDDEIFGEQNQVETNRIIEVTDELQDALLKNSALSNKGTFTLVCETYLNGIYQGEVESEEIYTIERENNLLPKIKGITNQDINDTTILVTGDVNQYIEGLSTVEITIEKLTSMKYAKLTRVEVLCMGNMYSKSFNNTSHEENIKISFPAPISDVNQQVTVVVYDTRGMSTQTETTLSMIHYQEPSFVSYSADREFNYNPATTLNAVVNYSKITVNDEDKNSLFSKYRVKETNAVNYGSWVDVQVNEISNQEDKTFRATIEQFMSNYDTSKSYDVQLWIGDLFHIIQTSDLTATFRLNKGISLLRLQEDGSHFESDVYIDNGSTIYLKEAIDGYEEATKQDGGVLAFRNTHQGFALEPVINSIGTNNTVSLARFNDDFGFFGFKGTGINAALNTFVTFDENGISINGTSQPYVVESRVEQKINQWNYIKWSDGRLEQWCISVQNNQVSNSMWGSVYASADIYAPDYAISYVGDLPSLDVQLLKVEPLQNGWLATRDIYPDLNQAGHYQIIRGTGWAFSSVTTTASFKAVGRWK